MGVSVVVGSWCDAGGGNHTGLGVYMFLTWADPRLWVFFPLPDPKLVVQAVLLACVALLGLFQSHTWVGRTAKDMKEKGMGVASAMEGTCCQPRSCVVLSDTGWP